MKSVKLLMRIKVIAKQIFFLSLVCVDTTATGWFFIDDSN